MPARTMLATANIALNAANELQKIDPEMAANFFPGADQIPIIVGAIPFLLIAAWALSIAFMLNIRRSSNDA